MLKFLTDLMAHFYFQTINLFFFLAINHEPNSLERKCACSFPSIISNPWLIMTLMSHFLYVLDAFMQFYVNNITNTAFRRFEGYFVVIYGLHVTRHDQAVHWSDLCYEHIVGLLYFAAFCCQFVSFDFYLYIFILIYSTFELILYEVLPHE